MFGPFDFDLPRITTPVCTCDDGKIYPDLGNAYPCSCPLGDKWVKGKGYMGPVTSVSSYIAKKEKAFNILKDNSGFNGDGFKVKFKSTPDTIHIVPKPEEVKVTTVKRIEIEEPVGRKFKNI